MSRLPHFYTIGSQMAVRLSSLRAGRPLPPGRFLVLISIRGCLDPRAIVRLGKNRSFDNPMTSSDIEPKTFRLVREWLNQLRYRVPQIMLSTNYKPIRIYWNNFAVRRKQDFEFHILHFCEYDKGAAFTKLGLIPFYFTHLCPSVWFIRTCLQSQKNGTKDKVPIVLSR
jgi:hypothetical protein